MTDVIEVVFGREGILSRTKSDYEPRPSQVAMARAVDEAILCDRRVAIEAPTGTGKSLGYLVPAIAHAVETRRRVVVATANIALQEQLIDHDLPFLSSVLPWPFTFALAKGKSNYACLRENAALDEYEAWQQDEVEGMRDWLAETQTGDFSEIHWELTHQTRRLFTIDHDECPGKKRCDFGGACWAEKAKARVASATVVVTNYHLLMAHLSLQAKIGKSSILPELDVLIMDECHKAADIARDFFGLRVTEGGIRRLARFLPKGDQKQNRERGAFVAELSARAGQLFSEITKLAPEHRPRMRTKLPVDLSRVRESLGVLAGIYERLALEQSDSEEGERYGGSDEEEHYGDEYGKPVRRGNEWDFRAQRTRECSATLSSLVQGDLDDGLVRFISTSGRSTALEAKPVDVGPQLEAELFSRCRSVVMTSATLAVGGDFDYFARDVGVKDYDSLIVESPFDFRSQCALAVCQSAPEPNTPEFTTFLCATLERVVRAAGGRVLGLFTSYRNLDAAHEYLARCKLPYKLLRQGHGERSRLLDEFKRDRTSVLLGTESFWAGVDVQGESLSVVLIDKLPFPNMNDPVLSALSERNPKKSFMRDSVPRAVIQLKQGFGRLIRTTTDRGVVVVVDPRIVTKRYGSIFVSSLPPAKISDDAVRAIEEMLGRQPTQLSLGAP